MSNRSIAIKNSAGDYASRGYGRDFRLPQARFDDIYAAYICGDVDHNDPLEDITGNGRDAASIGITFDGAFPVLAAGQSIECPFQEDELFAVSGGCTLFTLAKVPGAGLFPLMGNHGGAQSAELFANDGSGYNITNATAQGQTATDAAGYGLWTARAAILKPVGGAAYRRRASSASTFGTSASPHSSTWGATKVRIGSPYTTGGLDFGHSIAFAAALKGAWDQADLDAFYDELIPSAAQIDITL